MISIHKKNEFQLEVLELFHSFEIIFHNFYEQVDQQILDISERCLLLSSYKLFLNSLCFPCLEIPCFPCAVANINFTDLWANLQIYRFVTICSAVVFIGQYNFNITVDKTMYTK